MLRGIVSSVTIAAAAVVVELVDTLGLGPSSREAVGVQVPPTAPSIPSVIVAAPTDTMRRETPF